jgi:hypothetical protein
MSRYEDEDPRKKEKRFAAAFPWFSRAATPGTAWHTLLLAPQGALFRVGLGALVAVNASLGVGHLWNKKAVAEGRNAPFSFASPNLDRAGGKSGNGDAERPSMSSLIVGLGNVLGDDEHLVDTLSGVYEEEEFVDPDGAALDGAGSEGEGQDGQGADGEGEEATGEGQDGAAGNGAGGAGAAAGQLASAGGAGALGGSAGTSAMLKAGNPKGGAASARGGDAGKLSARRKIPVRGGRTISRNRGGAKGALGQLKFAKNQSRKAATASTTGGAAQTAEDAFQGQTAGGGGSAIDGAGTTPGSGGISSGQSDTPPGSVIPDSASQLSCPSGYILEGDSCKPIGGGNKTPWQNMIGMARALLIGAAALAAIGLFLLLKAPWPPWGQIIGGFLLGMALVMVVAAMAIGNQIQNQYGQKTQGDIINSSGSGAMQGTAPQ